MFKGQGQRILFAEQGHRKKIPETFSETVSIGNIETFLFLNKLFLNKYYASLAKYFKTLKFLPI